MNALKAFVVVLYMFFFSFSASATLMVTVSVVPENRVGLIDSGYVWAGYIELNIDGARGWAVTDFFSMTLYDPTWYNDPTPREMILYTRSDILAGAPVGLSQTPWQYDIATQFFIYGLAGVATQDNLWSAGFNEMVWKTAWSNTPWYYADKVYDQQTGVKLVDIYNSLLPSFSSSYNFDGIAGVLVDPQNPGREFLVQVAAIPVPSAVWLFGSVLLGLVGIARRRFTKSSLQ